MQKNKIYGIVKDYQAGVLDKFEAMDALNVDSIGDLLTLCDRFNVVSMQSDATQSDAEAPSPESFFTHE